jgi:Na+-transporting methylmalonyl-CoA/oxaloacetate decarboxylase gamma subunit
MTYQFVRMTLLIVVVSFMAACGVMEKKEGESAATEDKATFEQVYQQAEDALKKATEVGNAWRDTSQFLDSAKEAAAKEDYAQAISLAQKAKFEGEAAYSQHEEQSDAGPYLF